jgi:RNA polymerase sigma-70 factor (ECF subfamily)
VTAGRSLALPGAQEQALLADGVRRGEASAEERLVSLYHDRVRVLALARTRNPEAAKELAQDVVMAVIIALRNGQVREGEKLTAFVYGTARNHFNHYFRAGARTPDAAGPLSDCTAVEPADPIAGFERTALVRRAMATLSADDRKILLLTLVDGMKPGEIARRLGLSDEVVRTRKSRLLKKMIEQVDKLSRS